ncbi:MAG: hypothetical protein IJC78_07255 [Clostridia bacterium]|nr:hypothetical protein [Clostridia bacterium]
MFEHITLEMSLKPFKKTDTCYIRTVCERVFEQWKPLVKDAETVSVMLWCADGSELLDYRGNEEDSFEWCRFWGGANPREGSHADIDPEGLGLHSRNYPYMDHPPVMTYRILKEIVKEFKCAGKRILGENKVILVGETVDPGPEFAVSDFKYNRHNEICLGNDMGKATMVCAHAKLSGDNVSYAGFPNGIPDGLPFGTFLGRQAQAFLTDMGFDFLWLSNGLGFGRETWSAEGAIFDGNSFDATTLPEVKREVVEFWSLFRKECPDFPVRTRGTNMSAGIDMASDGVPLSEIYQKAEGVLPPPNSPWAAINFDFGLEIMGHMSRIAELPDKDYMFRYYIHDPWWLNSPRYDRYGGKPHDIYLPAAISRIDEEGGIGLPSHISFLSIDNSYGDLPDSCAVEPIPHLLKAKKDAPDGIAPLVWVYPFSEYGKADSGEALAAMYSGDWFVRGGINCGLPLSQVVSSDIFAKLDKKLFSGSICITPVPFAGSKREEEILSYMQAGGKVLLYGNMSIASEKMRAFFGIALKEEKTGEVHVSVFGEDKGKTVVDSVRCGGGLNAVAENSFAAADGYAAGVARDNAVWVQSIVSERNAKADGSFFGERLLVYALKHFGIFLDFSKEDRAKSPVLSVQRLENGFTVSVFTPDTTVETKVKTPLGAPVLIGYETEVSGNCASYRFPKAEHAELRAFVEQASGTVGCREVAPVSAQYRRRIELSGLSDATVRLFGESYCADDLGVVLNSHEDFYFVGDEISGRFVTDSTGTYFEAEHVTGMLVFSMPMREKRRF